MKSNSILVVFAGFFAQFICEGVGLGCELFLPYLQKSFSWTNAQVTLVGSGVNGLSFLLGPLSSYLAQKIGDRALVMFCGILGAIGFVSGSLSVELWQMVLTISLVGASFGLASVPTTTAVSFHFTKNRHLFTTVATTGGAVGGVLLPFVFESVLASSPWQYGYMLAAGIILHLVVCGALFVEPQTDLEDRKSLQEIVHDDSPTKITDQRSYSACSLWCFLLHSVIWNFGTFMYYTIIPLRLDKEDYSGYEIALVFSVISLFTIAGRLAACALVHWSKVDVVLVFNVSMLAMGTGLLWASWHQSLIIYLTAFALYGLFFGLATAVIPSVIITMVGMYRVKQVVGLEFFTAGIAGLLGPFTAGWIADLTDGSFFVVCVISSCLLFASVPLLLPFHWPLRK